MSSASSTEFSRSKPSRCPEKVALCWGELLGISVVVRVAEEWDMWCVTTAQGEERREGGVPQRCWPPGATSWFIHLFSFIHQTFTLCPL